MRGPGTCDLSSVLLLMPSVQHQISLFFMLCALAHIVHALRHCLTHRDRPVPIPGPGVQLTSLTHVEDVASECKDRLGYIAWRRGTS